MSLTLLDRHYVYGTLERVIDKGIGQSPHHPEHCNHHFYALVVGGEEVNAEEIWDLTVLH